MFIHKAFKHTTKVVVLTDKMLQEVIRQVPVNWLKKDDIRKYIAFVIPPAQVEEVAKDITMRVGVDSLKMGKNVLYMSTQLNGLTRSGFNKLATKKVYKSLTIRNFKTISKLYENTCSLMKQKKGINSIATTHVTAKQDAIL